MSYKIIVSRYNENIDWLKNEMNNCIIFNKGKKLGINNEILLENLGRESETYLHYIITNYHNLPDVVIFTQGSISDHLQIYHFYDNKFHNYKDDEINYLIKIKEETLINDLCYPFTHYQTNYNNCWDRNWNINNDHFFLENNYKDNKPTVFYDWFIKYINKDYPDPIYIYRNGIFAVKKENILKKSIEYYKNLILQVNHHINPAEGHFLERSWYYIFN